MPQQIQSLESAAAAHVQTFPTEVLAAFVRGDLDLMLAVRCELAARGLGRHGEWIGFKEATKLHLGIELDCKSGTPATPGLETLG